MKQDTKRIIIGLVGMIFVIYSFYLLIIKHASLSMYPEIIGLILISFSLLSFVGTKKYIVFLIFVWIVAGFLDVGIWERHGIEATTLESFLLNGIAIIVLSAGYILGRRYWRENYDIWKEENKIRYNYEN